MRPGLRHAAIVAIAFTLLFGWLFAAPIVHGGYLAESDLYEYFLPVFLSPITIWSTFEFGGAPAFADPGEPSLAPLNFLFARVIGSWTGFIVAAYVLGACGAYAYVFAHTRSRAAAAFSGVAYGLSEAMVERLAHMGTLQTIAWLPLIFLAVDRLRSARTVSWIAFGALVLANAFLAGNPQTFLYIGYALTAYALVGGVVERAPVRYYLAALATAVLGGMLTAAKSLPMLEASLYTARQQMRLENFYSYANTAPQMLSALFPSILHDGREAPTYVGLATLLFALVAMRRLLSNWRIAFWTVLAVLTLLIGMGPATPVAELAFHLPFYDKFRVGARHLILAAFALSALGGFGMAMVLERTVTRRVVAAASALLLLALSASAAALWMWPAAFAFDDGIATGWQLPLWPGGVWLSAGLGVVAIALARMLAVRPGRTIGYAIVALLAVDLVSALPYGISGSGLERTILPAAAAGPSVHAVRLAGELQPQKQRLLAVEGTHLDAVVPAAFARLWQIPIAGGYGPMLLSQYGRLGAMGTNGSVELATLSSQHAALDVMAVKFVILHDDTLRAGETIERQGVTWTSDEFALAVGPEECGQQHPRRASFGLPVGAPIANLAIAARLRCAEDVAQGAVVGTMRVLDPGGNVLSTLPLQAGVNIAEGNLSDPDVARRARHGRPAVVDADGSPFSYYLRLPLSTTTIGGRVEIELTGTSGWMEVTRVTALDAASGGTPLTEASLLTADTARWVLHASFATSRDTDRGVDEEGASETAVHVFENLRARPRAWLAHEVIPLTDEELDRTIAASQLPDGRRFDPALQALVPAGTAVDPQPSPSADGETVAVQDLRDGLVRVSVSAPNGGFLVLSETLYPGWRASIDGTPASIHRTDGALQGVFVPVGQHLVEFTFVSNTLRIGAAISLLALAVIGLIVWRSRTVPLP